MRRRSLDSDTGITEVLQADFLLHIVIVFGGYVGYQVPRWRCAYWSRLGVPAPEPLVVGGNVETVEDGPVQVDARIESLVKHPLSLVVSGGSGFGLGIVYGSLVAGGEVQCGQVARIAQCGVVLADLLFIADNAQEKLFSNPCSRQDFKV